MLKERINEKINSELYFANVPFPSKNLLIEVTNFCNNKCIFCYNHCMKREKKFIDKDMCLKVLHDAYNLGCREVGFYVTGEPLLDKRLATFIKFAKEIGYNYIYITTNGILANLDKVIELYNAGLNSIKYSINAINSEDYKYIHNTDNFQLVVDNLSSVYNWKYNNNIDLNVFVSFIATNKTYNYDNIKDYFKNICDELVVMPAVNQGGLIPDIPKLLSNNIETDINNNFKLPCNYLFNSIIVTVEGFLTCCCMDFENLLVYADLNNSSLKESWNNAVITNFRKRHILKNVKKTLCDNCVNNCLEIPNPISNTIYNYNNEINFCSHLKKLIKENKNGSN